MKLLPASKTRRAILGILLIVLLALIGRTLLLPAWRYSSYRPQEGDIIFQSLPPVGLVKMIEGVTQSPFSHCGVVVNRGGRWKVAESIGSVHDTSLLAWVSRGRGARFCVYRLRPEFRTHVPAFVKALDTYAGRPYDFDFQMDDSCLYCSELVFKAFRDASGIELGKLMRLGDLNWKPFEQQMRDYNGGDLPLDRVMITPRHLSEADQLEKVFASGL